MRTGTRTVRALSLMTSAPAMISGRLARTASRTFSSWRNQSRAPRENSSYHFDSFGGAVLLSLSLMFQIYACASFLRKQRGDVAQRFFGAVLVVAVFVNQTLLHHRYLLPRLIIRPRGGSDEPQHVAAFFEQILLDGLAHTGVARQFELLTGLERHHGLAHHFLPEGLLARIGHFDLLLHGAQEALVGRALLAGDRVAYLTMIQRGFDLIEIFLEQLLRLCLEG